MSLFIIRIFKTLTVSNSFTLTNLSDILVSLDKIVKSDKTQEGNDEAKTPVIKSEEKLSQII